MGKMIRSATVLFALAALAALASRAEAQATAQPKPSPLKAAAKEYSFEIRPTIGLVIPLAPSGDVGWDIGASFRLRPPAWPVGLQLDVIWIDGEFGLHAGVGADFAISGSPIGFFAETRFHVVFEPGDNPNLLPINAGVRIRF